MQQPNNRARLLVSSIALFSLMVVMTACDNGGNAAQPQAAVSQPQNAPAAPSNAQPVATAYRPGGQPTAVPKEVIPPAPALPVSSVQPLLSDDFSNTPISNYTIVDLGVDPTVQHGTWLVQDGSLVQAGDEIGNPGSFETLALTGDAAWSSYSVEAQAYSGATPLGLVVRYTKDGFYRLRVNRSNVTGDGWLLERYDTAQHTYTTLAKGGVGSGYERSQWNYLKLSAQGEQFIVTINGHQAASVTDSTYKSGSVGAYAEATGARFDNLRVTPLQ